MQTIEIDWKAKLILQQASRDHTITLQYRVGTSDSWTNVGSNEFSSTGRANNDSSTVFTDTLPVAANNQPVVQIRFLYWESAGTTGSRDRIAVDNIEITGQSATPSVLINPTSFNFGNQGVSTNSSGETFSISGNSLTGAPGNITVTPPSNNFEVSTDNVAFSASINIPYTTATLSTTNFYVRFTPQSAGAKTGNLGIAGGGVTSPQQLV